jgi:hypothetical protein
MFGEAQSRNAHHIRLRGQFGYPGDRSIRLARCRQGVLTDGDVPERRRVAEEQHDGLVVDGEQGFSLRDRVLFSAKSVMIPSSWVRTGPSLTGPACHQRSPPGPGRRSQLWRNSPDQPRLLVRPSGFPAGVRQPQLQRRSQKPRVGARCRSSVAAVHW